MLFSNTASRLYRKEEERNEMQQELGKSETDIAFQDKVNDVL